MWRISVLPGLISILTSFLAFCCSLRHMFCSRTVALAHVGSLTPLLATSWLSYCKQTTQRNKARQHASYKGENMMPPTIEPHSVTCGGNRQKHNVDAFGRTFFFLLRVGNNQSVTSDSEASLSFNSSYVRRCSSVSYQSVSKGCVVETLPAPSSQHAPVSSSPALNHRATRSSWPVEENQGVVFCTSVPL